MSDNTQPSLSAADCQQPAGMFRPVINRDRCEGKADCVAVCPYHVFQLDIVPKSQRAHLSLRGKIKGFAHGWRQSFASNAEACRACARCVAACPEDAVSLKRI